MSEIDQDGRAPWRGHTISPDGRQQSTMVRSVDHPRGEKRVCRGLRLCGYDSLAVGAVARDEAPLLIAQGLARHPIPVMILARLADDRFSLSRSS